MRQSPAFSDFRHLMDLWDNSCFYEDSSPKVKMLLDGNSFIMYFLKDDDLFGCTEEARLTFARIKYPEDEDPVEVKDMHFLATNLYDALLGKQTENMFGKREMKKIKIISHEKAEKLLAKKLAKKKNKKANPVPVPGRDEKDGGRDLQQED